MTTIKDIARLTGVSPSTVSRALNGSGLVEEATRRRVEEAAKALNYRPNLAAKGLRTNSSDLIGLLSEGSINYMFSKYIQYVSDYSIPLGYGLMVANHYNDPELEERMFHSLCQRNPNGIILSLVSEQSRLLNRIAESSIPIVLVDRYLLFDQFFLGTKHASITLDNYATGRMVAEYLYDLGHRQVACVTGPGNIGIVRERTRGFAEFMAEKGVSIPRASIVEGKFTFSTGYDAAGVLLKKRGLPTAIWAQNDTMAAGVLKAVYERGFRVPEDISVIGFDDIEFSQMTIPALTTVAQPYEAMARTAVEFIAAVNAGKDPQSSKFVFHPKLVIRESTACPKNL